MCKTSAKYAEINVYGEAMGCMPSSLVLVFYCLANLLLESVLGTLLIFFPFMIGIHYTDLFEAHDHLKLVLVEKVCQEWNFYIKHWTLDCHFYEATSDLHNIICANNNLKLAENSAWLLNTENVLHFYAFGETRSFLQLQNWYTDTSNKSCICVQKLHRTSFRSHQQRISPIIEILYVLCEELDIQLAGLALDIFGRIHLQSECLKMCSIS